MNASELEQIWNRQQSIKLSQEDIAQFAASVREVDQKFRRRIWWRDLREIGAALSVAAVFGLVGQSWLRWISVASSVFVAAFIIRSRIILRPARETPNVIAQLHQMIRETEMQTKLLRSVLWWYLLPCVVAISAFVLDRLPWKSNSRFLLIFGGTMGALSIMVYWWNQRAVRKVLEPRCKNLRHALGELSQPS
jgi:drug/metabolite transporter (DMT)-like permease